LENDSNGYFDGNLNLALGLVNWVMMLVYNLLLEIEFNCWIVGWICVECLMLIENG
jgi:hypothetical protein